jgi:AraC-like DNA-binding protein
MIVFNSPNVLTLSTCLPLEVSNGGLFVSRGQGIHPNRVIDSYELIFVKEGVLGLQEEDQRFEVQAGETLLLWPERRHWGTVPYSPRLSFYWLHFRLQESQPASYGTGEILSVPRHVSISRTDHLTNLFRRFLDDQETVGVQPLPAGLLVMLMLYEVAFSASCIVEAETAAIRLAERANSLIRTRFHTPLSTSSLADTLRCNPDYLGRIFRQVYGCTITEMIHHRRLKHARRLLLESEQTVERIAECCGFNDVIYFRRLFKRMEGMPPSAFRKLYARQHVITE